MAIGQIPIIMPLGVQLPVGMPSERAFWEIIVRVAIEALAHRAVGGVAHGGEVIADGEVEGDEHGGLDG